MAASAAVSTVSASPSAEVSLEEYLRISYNPDVKFVGGQLKEKPCGHACRWTVADAAFLLVRLARRRMEDFGRCRGANTGDSRSGSAAGMVVDHAHFWPETLVEPSLLVIEISFAE